MNSNPSARLISHLVGMIYDCVLEPEKWQAFLEELLAELHFSYGVLSISAFPEGNAIFGVIAGIAPDRLETLQSHWADVMALWGGDARIQQYPLEEPILQSEIIDPVEAAANPYYRSWFSPQGYVDAVAIGLDRNPHMVSSLALGRHETAGPVREIELAALRLLSPHLRRAISIAQQEMQSIAASAYASVVEGLPVAAILVDELMTIIHANTAAQTLLAEAGPFKAANNKLSVIADMGAAVERAVARPATSEASLDGGDGAGLPVIGADDRAYVVHVLPLRQRENRGPLCLPAAAALFITQAGDGVIQHSRSAALLYRLTPAESRIFDLLTQGRRTKEIAGALGLSSSTIKTHIRNIYTKTGAARQADLIRVAGSLRM
jgi:DNA-binding CsgD family transcriptional regulator/PAS domain-containing protein